MKFEKRIIDPILRTIKKHQDYLTLSENLDQLAKLGYMYNTLWYSGRHASYEGVIEKNQCDENPKYKIEVCLPKTDKIENLIYDAWSMHVTNDFVPAWTEFSTIILEGKHLSNNEIKLLKKNKTFDDWVEVLTDKSYRYSSNYPDKKSVANHLLCVIGNGYGFQNGFIVSDGAADTDISDYGDWRNAKFNSKIQVIVDKIMTDPDVEKVLRFMQSEKEAYEEKERQKEIKIFGMTRAEYFEKNSDKLKDVFRTTKDSTYYPICHYSAIWNFDKDTDHSYINAGIEICEEILNNENESHENIKFAHKYLDKFKK